MYKLLYQKVSCGWQYKMPLWDSLFYVPNLDHLPHWAPYVRKIEWKGKNWVWPKPLKKPIDFRKLYPILEQLKGLREIESSDKRLELTEDSGVEELTNRISSLKVFRWKRAMLIKYSTQVFLCCETDST